MESIPDRGPRRLAEDVVEWGAGGGSEGLGDSLGLHCVAGPWSRGEDGSAGSALAERSHPGTAMNLETAFELATEAQSHRELNQ